MSGSIMPPAPSASGGGSTANEVLEDSANFLEWEYFGNGRFIGGTVLNNNEIPFTINSSDVLAKSKISKPFNDGIGAYSVTIKDGSNALLGTILGEFASGGQVTPATYTLDIFESSPGILNNNTIETVRVNVGNGDSAGEAIGTPEEFRLTYGMTEYNTSDIFSVYNKSELINNASSGTSGISSAEYGNLYVCAYDEATGETGSRTRLRDIIDPFAGFTVVGSINSSSEAGSIPNGTTIELATGAEIGGVLYLAPIDSFTITASGGLRAGVNGGKSIVRTINPSINIKDYPGTLYYREQGSAQWHVGSSGYTQTVITSLPFTTPYGGTVSTGDFTPASMSDLPRWLIGRHRMHSGHSDDRLHILLGRPYTDTVLYNAATNRKIATYKISDGRLYYSGTATTMFSIDKNDVNNTNNDQDVFSYPGDTIYDPSATLSISVTTNPTPYADSTIVYVRKGASIRREELAANSGTVTVNSIATNSGAPGSTNTTNTYPLLKSKTLGSPDWSGDLAIPPGSNIQVNFGSLIYSETSNYDAHMRLKIPVKY